MVMTMIMFMIVTMMIWNGMQLSHDVKAVATEDALEIFSSEQWKGSNETSTDERVENP